LHIGFTDWIRTVDQCLPEVAGCCAFVTRTEACDVSRGGFGRHAERVAEFDRVARPARVERMERGIVGYMVVTLAALVLIVGSAAVVLIRRDRRRVYDSPDSARIEAQATRGLRDARRRAHAAQHVSDSGAVSAARDRDPGIGNL
jgi:hypothetical protein